MQSSCYGTKRKHIQAFPEEWYDRHSKRMKNIDGSILSEESILENEIADLELRWDILDDEIHKIYESIGAIYDTLRRRIRAFPVQDDDIAVNMSYREGISMVRALYDDSTKLMDSLQTAQTEVKRYEEMLLNNYVEYLKIRDSWLQKMAKLSEITDQVDAIVLKNNQN